MKKETSEKTETPVETRATDAEIIGQKMQAGLTREQAEQVVKDQNENDKNN